MRSLLASSCSFQQRILTRPITIQPLPCRLMSRFDKMKIWKKTEEPVVVEEEEPESEVYEKQVMELELEARAEYIETKRNKSKLSASHRQILMGKPPFEGNLFEYTSQERSKEYKRSLLSKYGKRETGVEPS